MTKVICFAGGCFWGVEKYVSRIKGVVETSVGYANGTTEFPTYEDVCYADTGHAEAVLVHYDPDIISLERLLELFYKIIDPTTINRQGPDHGTQYRSGVYYDDPSDLPCITASLEKLQKQYDKPLVVEVKPLDNFYLAEEYHQNYLDKNPSGYCHINPRAFAEAAQA